MLNELLRIRFGCPVCGRVLYYPLRGYWCPYCGADLDHNNPIEIEVSTNRLTARTENGTPYYIGQFTNREHCWAQDMGLSAIAEVLEKLAQYEDAEEAADKEEVADGE